MREVFIELPGVGGENRLESHKKEANGQLIAFVEFDEEFEFSLHSEEQDYPFRLYPSCPMSMYHLGIMLMTAYDIIGFNKHKSI